MQLIDKNSKYRKVKRFDKGKPIKVDQQQDPRLLNPSESTRINSPYIKEKALKPTQKVDPDRMGIEEFIPFIGDASDVVSVGNDINAGNYRQAALGAGLLLLPNFLEKPLKAVGKAVKRGVKKRFGNTSSLRTAKDPFYDYSKVPVSNNDDVKALFKEGKMDTRAFLQNQVIEEADEHNRKLFNRIHKYDGLDGITEERLYDFRDKVKPEVIYKEDGDFAARYNPTTKQLQLNLSIPQSKEEAIKSLAHEYRHHSKYGESPTFMGNRQDINNFYDMKNKRLWKKDLPFEEGESYLYKSQEGYNNAIDAGRRLGLQLGQPYPGRKAVEDLLNNYKGIGGFVMRAFDTSSGPRAKRVWDAMTGRYVIVPAVVGGAMLNDKNYE